MPVITILKNVSNKCAEIFHFEIIIKKKINISNINKVQVKFDYI